MLLSCEYFPQNRWFHFQDVLSYEASSFKNFTNKTLFKSTDTVYYILMVQFESENNTELISVWNKCDSCKKHAHFNIIEAAGKDIIPVFIKAVVLHNVVVLWLIQTKKKIYFYVNEVCPN